MKSLLLLAVLFGGTIMQAQTISITRPSTLQRVEKLTDSEKAKLLEAETKLAAAQVELTKTKAEIAAQHNMATQSYMEWSTWVDFEGDYVLYRCQNYMGSNAVFNGGVR